MNDYLSFLEAYKGIKEVSDLMDEVKKLREYFCTQQYEKMQEHINQLTQKYFVETVTWNMTHPTPAITVQQAYYNAEAFLRLKGLSLLLKNGLKLQEQLSSEEKAFIEETFGPIR